MVVCGLNPDKPESVPMAKCAECKSRPGCPSHGTEDPVPQPTKSEKGKDESDNKKKQTRLV
jgi:hypothetical protein